MSLLGVKKKSLGLITPPSGRLLKSLPLSFANKSNLSGKRSGYADLNLTSMVDMMTILVIFLIQFFSTTGELTPPSPRTKLPLSPNYQKFIQDVPTVGINRDGLYFKNVKYIDYSELESKSSSHPSEWIIEQFKKDLCIDRDVEDFMKKNPDGNILFYVDEGVKFAVLKQAMYNAAYCRYTSPAYATKKPS